MTFRLSSIAAANIALILFQQLISEIRCMDFREKFKMYAGVIINPAVGYGDIKRAIDALYILFVEIGAYKMNKEYTTAEGTFLNTGGLAVSISTAAECLFDIARTSAFAKGLLSAIKGYKRTGDQPLQILYAGCGPYALYIYLYIYRFFIS